MSKPKAQVSSSISFERENEMVESHWPCEGVLFFVKGKSLCPGPGAKEMEGKYFNNVWVCWYFSYLVRNEEGILCINHEVL